MGRSPLPCLTTAQSVFNRPLHLFMKDAKFLGQHGYSLSCARRNSWVLGMVQLACIVILPRLISECSVVNFYSLFLDFATTLANDKLTFEYLPFILLIFHFTL